jgi:hypothetical protein
MSSAAREVSERAPGAQPAAKRRRPNGVVYACDVDADVRSALLRLIGRAPAGNPTPGEHESAAAVGAKRAPTTSAPSHAPVAPAKGAAKAASETCENGPSSVATKRPVILDDGQRAKMRARAQKLYDDARKLKRCAYSIREPTRPRHGVESKRGDGTATGGRPSAVATRPAVGSGSSQGASGERGRKTDESKTPAPLGSRETERERADLLVSAGTHYLLNAQCLDAVEAAERRQRVSQPAQAAEMYLAAGRLMRYHAREWDHQRLWAHAALGFAMAGVAFGHWLRVGGLGRMRRRWRSVQRQVERASRPRSQSKDGREAADAPESQGLSTNRALRDTAALLRDAGEVFLPMETWGMWEAIRSRRLAAWESLGAFPVADVDQLVAYVRARMVEPAMND